MLIGLSVCKGPELRVRGISVLVGGMSVGGMK
jgi:hypothetical protein